MKKLIIIIVLISTNCQTSRTYDSSGVQYSLRNNRQKYPSYNTLSSRYHPQTFHNTVHNLKPEGSQQIALHTQDFHNVQELNTEGSQQAFHAQNFHNVPQKVNPEGNQQFHTQNFHNIPQELEAEGDTEQIQYAYQGGESHEGEVINQGEEEEGHYKPEGNYHDYHPQEGYPNRPGYPYGYHYPHPLPPPPPPPPPRPLLPHKSKQHTAPYTYYYIGRHLWYIPLYFSIYFIVYVGLLVLKSIARHKVLFPENLQAAAASSTSRDLHVLRSIEQAKKRYFMK